MPAIARARAQAPFVLALDLGTSSLRLSLFDARARRVKGFTTRRAHRVGASADGAATLDARALFDAFCDALDELTAKFNAPIAVVAAASLAHNVLALDANNAPLTPAYLYSDTQNARAVEQLRATCAWTEIYARTGCPLHTSYLPARLAWLRATQPEIFARAAHWVSLHEYFLRRLFGYARVSHSFAAWSGLLNHATLDWDAETLSCVGVTRAQLSPVSSVYEGLRGLREPYATRWKELAKVAWLPAVGDGAAANLGSGCVDATRIAITVGTSGAMRVILPHAPAAANLQNGLWLYRVDEADALVGGSLNNGGNVFEYFARILRLPARDALERELGALAPDAHGLTLLPFFAGERSPGYRGSARALVAGWKLGATPIELWRATLEAIAYRFATLAELLRAVTPAREFIASGAALEHSRVWTQIIADVLGAPVTRSGEAAATARGAALIGLRAAGVISEWAALPAARGETFAPRAEYFERYQRARARQKMLYYWFDEQSGCDRTQTGDNDE